eukprot:m.337389 g.337389  ORF g.337389 m.337389 type:complete len:476 (-) comp18115_c0_seq1:108-1535(-)
MAVRWMSTMARGSKIQAPPMVYISGEEMTHYAMNLIMDNWIKPNVDVSKWEFFDLSCRGRDSTDDKVLQDCVDAGARIGAIFKEPTVTPTDVQKRELGLKRAYGSPNGAMRRGWNGITISRDTIHIEGVKLGYQRPVLIDRHAVGGEYGAKFVPNVGPGKVTTTFYPEHNGTPVKIYEEDVVDKESAIVSYHNPLDNVYDMAHHFFSRCLDEGVTPYIVTKHTVFRWQSGFFTRMKTVFDEHYKQQFLDAGLLEDCDGELAHINSDSATIHIIRWSGGGFGMAAHNYDGDMLSDEIAQVHRSPGFINSILIGKRDDGVIIKEYEASHGTVADMWHAHLRGEETSINPLGMVEALVGAMLHSAQVSGGHPELEHFALNLRAIMHKSFSTGKGTRDLAGPEGLTTEQYVEYIREQIESGVDEVQTASVKKDTMKTILNLRDVKRIFTSLDTDDDGEIDMHGFVKGVLRSGLAPSKTA